MTDEAVQMEEKLAKLQGRVVAKTSEGHYGKFFEKANFYKDILPEVHKAGLFYSQMGATENGCIGVRSLITDAVTGYQKTSFFGAPIQVKQGGFMGGGASAQYFRRMAMLIDFGLIDGEPDPESVHYKNEQEKSQKEEKPQKAPKRAVAKTVTAKDLLGFEAVNQANVSSVIKDLHIEGTAVSYAKSVVGEYDKRITMQSDGTDDPKELHKRICAEIVTQLKEKKGN